MIAGAARAQEEPPLPAGLQPAATQPSAEPALPTGLGSVSEGQAEEPELPAGLAAGPTTTAPAESQEKRDMWEALGLRGFWEVRGGVRTQHDTHERDASLGETRLQLEWEELVAKKYTFKLTTDLLYDAVRDRHTVDLERGEGLLDLREAFVAFTPAEFMDVKLGRQILTWGTGDLLFLNDLFPKDWQAFFIGRDVEYLKAPSDALKVSLFIPVANWDVVFTPRFDADRFIRGERLSYYNPLLGRRAGHDAVQTADAPDDWFRDSEWATRVWKNVKGLELAGYGYWGYWKSPAGFDPLKMQATFPRLSVYGGSVRGQLWGGVASGEIAYYDSREDRAGHNRFIDNSQWRFLTGYERQLPEITSDLTVGGQYYLEWLQDYDQYTATLLPGFPQRDELRHVVTLRVEKLLLNQNLTLAVFTFYSPSDSDAYLRPLAQYKLDDHWRVEVGGNVFLGSAEHTFFGQFARNTNAYVGLRFSF